MRRCRKPEAIDSGKSPRSGQTCFHNQIGIQPNYFLRNIHFVKLSFSSKLKDTVRRR